MILPVYLRKLITKVCVICTSHIDNIISLLLPDKRA